MLRAETVFKREHFFVRKIPFTSLILWLTKKLFQAHKEQSQAQLRQATITFYTRKPSHQSYEMQCAKLGEETEILKGHLQNKATFCRTLEKHKCGNTANYIIIQNICLVSFLRRRNKYRSCMMYTEKRCNYFAAAESASTQGETTFVQSLP